MLARPLTLVLAVLPTVVRGSSTYVCVQFVNNDFPQSHVNTCQLRGLTMTTMNGWKATGQVWATFACEHCNTPPPSANQTATEATLTESRLERRAQELEAAANHSTNDMYPCCQYSDPSASWMQPIDGEGLDPTRSPVCPSTLYGLKLMGAWSMDSMYNCLLLGPY